MSITVIGLGCCSGDLTQRGLGAIQGADYVILRTEKTQSSKQLKNISEYIALDNLYEKSDTFDALNDNIANAVIEYSKKGRVAYCVEGSGLDDESVKTLARMCDISIIPGVAKESSVAVATKGFFSALTTIPALDFVNEKAFFAPYGTLIIKDLDDRYLASDVKLKVLELYGNIDIFLIDNTKAVKIKAAELDMQSEYSYDTAIIIEEKAYLDKERFSFGDLMSIVYRLRAKDGCKWDREQTHQSIKINCIEEAYELVEAIDLDDIDKMTEESGDVLLQGVFHAIIAEDFGEYSVTDMLTVLSKKLLNRHTHIFDKGIANTEEEALKAWEAAKVKEKNQNSYTQRMEQVATNLPALIRANKVQKIAKKANFDWENIEGPYEKLQEEIEELKNALPHEREEEGGDVLFAAVNFLRHMKVEPELALNGAIKKFMDRFEKVENRVIAQNKEMGNCTIEELDAIYREIKNANR